MVQEVMSDRLLRQQATGINHIKGAIDRKRPSAKPMTLPQEGKINIMIKQLKVHNPRVGYDAQVWFDRNAGAMTIAQASEVIDRLKIQLAKPAVVSIPPDCVVSPDAGAPFRGVNQLLKQVPNGRYAVDRNGKVHFFVVKLAHPKAKFRVVREKASDVLHKMYPNAQESALREILATGLEVSGMLYADTLSECRNCGRDLTDTDNPYKQYGYGPDCGPKVMG